ncbi:hypothetical protein D3C84_750610 [compost metagenome]
MFQFSLTQLQQMPPGTRAMLGVALGETCQAQAQLIALCAKLNRTVTQHVIGRAVTGLLEFDLDAFGAQRGRADTG